MTSQNIANTLWSQANLKAKECLYHPFVSNLASGTLDKEAFHSFLLQDAYFLNGFAKAYAFAITKATTMPQTLALIKLMSGVQEELETHSSFLQSFGFSVFSIEESTAVPATKNYVDFLLKTAKEKNSVAEILATMTPCMRLYAYIGQSIDQAWKQVVTIGDYSLHPYGRWIETYCCTEFEDAAVNMETLLNDIAASEGVEYTTLLPLYNRAMELELEFFEQYLPLKSSKANYHSGAVSIQLLVTKNDDVTSHNRTNIADWICEESIDKTSELSKVLKLDDGHYTVDINCTGNTGETLSIQKTDNNALSAKSDLGTVSLYAFHIGNLRSGAIASFNSSQIITCMNEDLFVFLKLMTGVSFRHYSAPRFPISNALTAKVLIIAGSDSGGGAGIQADMKACTNLGVFSTTAITAITAQNTLGVHDIHAIPLPLVTSQLNAILDDIGSDVVKTGMLFDEDIIGAIADRLAKEFPRIPFILDPVMVATSGDRLLKPEAHAKIVSALFPLATVITPNIPEASILLNSRKICTVEDMKSAAIDLQALGPAFVLVKGGHLEDTDVVYDVLYDGAKKDFHVIESPRLHTRNTHGTGCTLASSIAACLAKIIVSNDHQTDNSQSVVLAVKQAISYVHNLLEKSQHLQIGKGDNGPMLHVI